MVATQPLHVLLVERDARTRSQLAQLLTEEGYQTELLAEPRRAPDRVEKGRYQMVILDLGEPEGSGLDVLQRIRSVDDDLCVICTTERPSVEGAVATMKHRAFDYLEKPVGPESLRPVLSAAVREHGLVVDPEERLNRAIGERIRARRHELALTLKQVARRTGLSVSLISQIELGRSAASVMTLYKVSAALGVRVASFFEAV